MKHTGKFSLSAKVHLVLDKVGTGKNQRGIRRPYLVDEKTGLLLELPTTYVLRSLGKRALNTQIATLYDLAFYLEWVHLQTVRIEKWIRPETRIRAGRLALSQREVDDFAIWCQMPAKELSRVRTTEASKGVRILHAEHASVEGSTTNRRLLNVCNYLCWLTRDMVEGAMMVDDRQIAKSSKFQDSLRRAFHTSISSVKSPPRISSLSSSDSSMFRTVTATTTAPVSEQDIRDRLIGRLLIDTGLRSGELLKLKCEDLQDNFEIRPGRYIAVLKVIRRPNDIEDDRMLEPSVKTLPGPVTISRKLSSQIIDYVRKERRAAIDRRGDRNETPYLFVSHSGMHCGRPISYRNLNRIIAKLRAKSNIGSNLSPHILRHTHFTELRSMLHANGVDPKEARRLLQERGHWSPNSSMPDDYSQRHLAERHAYFVEKRDRILDDKQGD